MAVMTTLRRREIAAPTSCSALASRSSSLQRVGLLEAAIMIKKEEVEVPVTKKDGQRRRRVVTEGEGGRGSSRYREWSVEKMEMDAAKPKVVKKKKTKRTWWCWR